MIPQLFLRKPFVCQVFQQQLTIFSLNESILFFHSMLSSVSLLSQLGPNIKELFRLVEDFVDVIGLRMKEFQDMYEVTDNLGQSCLHQGDLYNYLFLSKQIHLSLLFFL